jgi:cysteine-rich repeat protein
MIPRIISTTILCFSLAILGCDPPEPTCRAGSLGCECKSGDRCNDALVCVEDICQPAAVLCGNGTVDDDEACDDGNTTTETGCPYGTATCEACDAICQTVLPLTGATCGDGTNDTNDGETCDPIATCPVDCFDDDPCTDDTLIGNAHNCDAECPHTLTTPTDNDGCCPTGENGNTDNDCESICGNDVAEPGESCDDGNQTPGDGCTTCALDFGFTCDTLVEPSVCLPHQSIGTFGVGDDPQTVEATTDVSAGESNWYSIVFTEAVLSSGRVTSVTTGDPDVYIYDTAGLLVGSFEAGGSTEVWIDQSFAAGTYYVEIGAFSTLVNGYTLDFDTLLAP